MVRKHPKLAWCYSVQNIYDINTLLDCKDNYEMEAWWVCPGCGKQYKKTIQAIVDSDNFYCDDCKNKFIGVPSLGDTYPELVDLYRGCDIEGYRVNIYPYVLPITSSIKTGFDCEQYGSTCGHRIWVELKSFLQHYKDTGISCYRCSGLDTVDSSFSILSEYDNWIVNSYSKLNTVSVRSANARNMDAEYIWECRKGHRYICSLKDRLAYKKFCLVCKGIISIPGQNDLSTLHPDIVEMWDKSKNNVDPSTIFLSDYDNEYWFICKNGHSFKSSVNQIIKSMLTKAKGCPICKEDNIKRSKMYVAMKYHKLEKSRRQVEQQKRSARSQYKQQQSDAFRKMIEKTAQYSNVSSQTILESSETEDSNL